MVINTQNLPMVLSGIEVSGNVQQMSISTTMEKNVATNTVSKYLNMGPHGQYVTLFLFKVQLSMDI